MELIRYVVRDKVAELYLSRPPVNALDIGMLDALVAALNRANDDPQVRAIIISSDLAKRFCAGLDLKQLLECTPEKMHRLLTRLYIDLYDTQFKLTKPSIAAVAGAVRGGGMTVAISCDLIVAAETATFGYPEIDVGVLPAIHFAHLPRIVGKHRAFDLLFTGRVFDAAQAKEFGLVARTARENRLMDEARELAWTFANKPAEILAMGRRAFVFANDNDYRREIATAVEVFCNTAATLQAREGMLAFTQKRRPNWG